MIIEEKHLVEVNEVIKLIHNRATTEDIDNLLDGLLKLTWYDYVRTDKGFKITRTIMDTK